MLAFRTPGMSRRFSGAGDAEMWRCRQDVSSMSELPAIQYTYDSGLSAQRRMSTLESWNHVECVCRADGQMARGLESEKKREERLLDDAPSARW